jgi:transposase-like protein
VVLNSSLQQQRNGTKMKNSQTVKTEQDFLQEMIDKSIQGSMTGVLEHLVDQIMILQRQHFLSAGPYERTENRAGYSNGFKPLTIKGHEGKLNLNVPQVRDTPSSFRPPILDYVSRSEKALRAAIGEMYIQGVSTRKVSKIMKNLWPEGVSSTTVSNMTKELDESLEAFNNRPLEGSYQFVWLDATYEKVRQNGVVKSFAVLIAIGLNDQGFREVLGVSGQISEAEIHWKSFLESLLERGLKGVKLIISDDHSGLRNARNAVLPSVDWQRCIFHLQQNAQSKVSSIAQRKQIAMDIKAILSQQKLDDAEQMLKRIEKKWEKKAPQFSEWVFEACSEAFTFYKYQSDYWPKIRTSNPLERLNREIKRRTKVAGIFPSEKSCVRLISALLVETHENWSNRVYITKKEEA